MKRVRVKVKPIFVLAIIIILITVLIFAPFIFGKRLFLFSADQQLQYNYFYHEWARLLQKFIAEKSFPFYSFYSFLGDSFFASKFYILTGDFIILFFIVLNATEIGLMWETYILILVSGVSFYVWMKQFGIKNTKVIIWISVIYAFCGMANLYVGQYMFHRFYAFLPFLFASIEYYYQRKKVTPFAISIFLLFITNYYFMFPTTLFLIPYCFFSRIYHTESVKLKKIVCDSIPLVFVYIVGILLSGALSIPGILYILGNSRIGENKYSFFLYDLKIYIGYIYSFLVAPFNIWTWIPNIFAVTDSGHLSWYSLSTSVLGVPIIFSVFRNYFYKTDIKNKCITILVTFLAICSLVAPLSSMMHGFSNPSFRWAFLIVAVNCMIIAIYMDHFAEYQKSILFGAKLYILLFLITTALGIVFQIIRTEHWIYLSVTFLCLLLLLLYLFLIKKGKLRILAVLTVVEVVSFYSVHLYILNRDYYQYEPTLDEELIQYYQQEDDDLFYRIYVNSNELLPTSPLNLNQSCNMEYRSTMAYDSTHEPNMEEFLSLNGLDLQYMEITNPEVLRMLGVKYFYVKDESELPEGYSFTYFNNMNHLSVYRLDNYRSIGYTYSKFRTEACISRNDNGKCLKNDLDWNNELLIEENLINQIADIVPNPSASFTLTEYYDDNNLSGTIVTEEKSVLFFSIPYNKGWKVYVDGEQVETFKVQGGFIGVILESGHHDMRLNYMPLGLKLGVLATAGGFIMLLVLILIDKRKNNHTKIQTMHKQLFSLSNYEIENNSKRII